MSRQRNSPRRKRGPASQGKHRAVGGKPISIVRAEQAIEAQLELERQARNDILADGGPCGAAEALRFLVARAVERQIRSLGGHKAIKKVLGTVIHFDTWRAQQESKFEADIVRLVQQAAWAPRSMQDLKRFPGGPRGNYQAARVTRIATRLMKTASTIRALDDDEYWAAVRSVGLVDTLEMYAKRLLTVADTIKQIEKPLNFKGLSHGSDVWLLGQIKQLVGQSFWEKTNVIMRAVYPRVGHTPIDAKSLERWQRRQRGN